MNTPCPCNFYSEDVCSYINTMGICGRRPEARLKGKALADLIERIESRGKGKK